MTELLIHTRGETTSGAKRLMGQNDKWGRNDQGENDQGETSWGETTRGGNGLGRNVLDSSCYVPGPKEA